MEDKVDVRAPIYVVSTGCVGVRLDTARVRDYLITNSYRVTSELSDAKVVVLSSCIVNDPKEQASLQVLDKSLAAGKTVIVIGCGSEALRQYASPKTCLFLSRFDDIANIYPSISATFEFIEYKGDAMDFGYVPHYLDKEVQVYTSFMNALSELLCTHS